ncbi:MAG: transcription elongation factor GreA [Lachnospiraceae bacterium]|nr:transcription elongation factor GreA [Lachnospiraceae bacterium]
MAEIEIKKVRMTQAEKDRKEEKLQYLKSVRRQEVAQKLQEAREQGDLSENAEYDAAKDEQRDIEAEIMKLEELFKNVEIITDEDISSDTVGIGTTVRVLNLKTNKEKTYMVVGSTEANSIKGKISNESPIGRELENCVVGDEVVVRSPMGETAYRVLEIWKTETAGA